MWTKITRSVILCNRYSFSLKIYTGYFSCFYNCWVQFSHSVVSDSLRPHELQHARPPCPSPTPGIYPNLWIESVMTSSHLVPCCPFPLLPPIPPSIRVFSSESALHIRWPKYWSFSFRISRELPMNTQDWSPLGGTGWISLQSKGLSRVFSDTSSKALNFWHSAFFFLFFFFIYFY